LNVIMTFIIYQNLSCNYDISHLSILMNAHDVFDRYDLDFSHLSEVPRRNRTFLPLRLSRSAPTRMVSPKILTLDFPGEEPAIGSTESLNLP